MFSLLYNLVLFLIGLAALPSLLWQWMRYGKYRETLSERLGLNLSKLPQKKTGPVFWIHAVSMGETKAVVPLFNLIRQSYPDATLVISSTTETGHAEAKRCMPQASAHFFLPLDFSWQIKRVVKKISPDVLILVESDFWYHLLHFAKKEGAKIFLVNGKVSDRSLRRFALFSFFTRRLFSYFDRLCIQSEKYKESFIQMGIAPEKLVVTGNVKFDHLPRKLTSLEIQSWKEELGISSQDRVVAIGSTHEPEEEWLLSALDQVWKEIPDLKVLLVPRHPERFGKVAAHLETRGLSVISYSKRAEKTGKERVVLIDAMGLLHTCYQLAEVAIVAGSFIQEIGGHNIFEPAECGIPVLFGPYMEDQLNLVDLVVKARAGRQVKLIELPATLLDLLQNPEKSAQMSAAGYKLAQEAQGSSLRTWNTLQEKIELK